MPCEVGNFVGVSSVLKNVLTQCFLRGSIHQAPLQQLLDLAKSLLPRATGFSVL